MAKINNDKSLYTIKKLIRGEQWSILVMADYDFDSEYGPDTAAITIVEERKIVLPLSNLEFVWLMHEVFHAYSAYLHLESTTKLNLLDIEEINAEMISRHGLQMIITTTDILKELYKKLKIKPKSKEYLNQEQTNLLKKLLL